MTCSCLPRVLPRYCHLTARIWIRRNAFLLFWRSCSWRWSHRLGRQHSAKFQFLGESLPVTSRTGVVFTMHPGR
jgi:hypothetical protein